MTKKTIVFGLGSMGYGIAKSLLNNGLEVRGFDVNSDAETRFFRNGGATSERGVAIANAPIIICVVINAAQTEDVLFGEDGIAGAMKQGSVFISSATVAPDFARHMEARLGKLGVYYLDAPISGGSGKAATGKLTVMASGTAAAFETARPALDVMAELVFELGDCAGAGSAMKIVNQLLAGIHIAAAAEAMTFGISQGIEAAKILEVITRCAGTSWMFENRGAHIATGDYTPHSAVDIFVKDLGIVSDVARGSKFLAPLTAAALQQFVAASGAGFGNEDDAAVAKIYARNAGLKLPGGS